MLGIPIEWQLPIITAILAIFVGIIIEKYRNRQPKIEYYLSNMSDFHIPSTTQGQPPIGIYTHSIVVHNTGRAPATNIEIVHRISRTEVNQSIWYRINPDVQFSEDTTPEGGLMIQIERLLPNTAITISYLYTCSYRVDFIHNYVTSNEITGVPITILYARQIPKWLQKLNTILLIFGGAYLAQIIILLVKELILKS